MFLGGCVPDMAGDVGIGYRFGWVRSVVGRAVGRCQRREVQQRDSDCSYNMLCFHMDKVGSIPLSLDMDMLTPVAMGWGHKFGHWRMSGCLMDGRGPQ